MERVVELVAIVAFVVVIALGLFGRNPGSRRGQVIVGGAIGAVSALAIATQQTDLIPDELEIPVAIAALVAAGLFLIVARHRARASST
jgi:prepilin signal peptidase PulO-like enzyme (type II secretory pathway)